MKTKEEKAFDKLLDDYFDKFGKNYPLDITSCLSTEEHISRIKSAIQDDKPVKKENDIKGVIY